MVGIVSKMRSGSSARRPALGLLFWWAWPWALAVCAVDAHAQAPDGALGLAVARIETETAAGRAGGLAVHVTSSGHWQLANAKGEMVTAAGAQEVRRAIATLSPHAGADTTGGANGSGPVLLLTDEAAGAAADLVDQLPQPAALRVLVGDAVYRLERGPQADKADRLLAQVRPHLMLEVAAPEALREVHWQLGRKLDPSSVRLLSLEPGGPRTVPVAPRREPGGRGWLPDAADPYGLTKSLPALRGQKVLIVGRIEKELLWFQPRSGPEQSVLMHDVREAATANDIGLVVLDSRLPRQPGERTWAYLRINVPGLDEAMKSATVGDFYNAIASAQGKLILRVRAQTAERVRLEAVPVKPTWGASWGPTWAPTWGPTWGGSGTPGSGPRTSQERSVGGVLQDLVSGLTGSIVTNGVHMDLRSRARQSELDRRWLPGLPSALQMGYALLLALGVAAWPTAARWWVRIWPAEDRGEYDAVAGYWAARAIRSAIFCSLFLPAVAVAAFPLQVARGLAETLVLILKSMASRRRKTSLSAAAADPQSRIS